MRKVFSILLVLALMLGCVCAASAEAGTYTGTADGRNGPLTVEVVLADGKIENVTVTDHQETEGIGTIAVDGIPAAIVENQSISVDAVTGATITSEAILAAVTDALKTAGADIDAFTKDTGAKEENSNELVVSDEEYDVIVVGAGAAGLMASVTAAEGGLKTLVLEKMPYLGGNMKISAGIIQAAGTSIQAQYGIEGDTVEAFMEDDKNPDSPYETDYSTDDPVFTRIMYEGCADIVEELVGRGMEFVDFEPATPRYHIMSPALYQGGNTLTNLLQQQGEAAGAVYKVDAPAKELVTDEAGNVVGVIAEEAGQRIQYNCPAVILCTGGFSSNNELVSQYYPKYANLRSRASVGATGDGFLMATAVGAATRGMDTDQQMFFVSADTDTDVPLLLTYCSAILVNQKGDRFVNEDINYCLAARATALEEGQVAYIVFGEAIRQNRPEVQGYIDNGAVVEAESIEALAEKIGTPDLVDTLAHYNELAEAGEDTEFGRVVNFETLTSDGSWYAIKVAPAIYNSYGGIAIDTDTHVLKEDGSIIGGLYAAGEVTGSPEVWEGYFYTTGNGQGLVYGKIAAETVMAEKK